MKTSAQIAMVTARKGGGREGEVGVGGEREGEGEGLSFLLYFTGPRYRNRSLGTTRQGQMQATRSCPSLALTEHPGTRASLPRQQRPHRTAAGGAPLSQGRQRLPTEVWPGAPRSSGRRSLCPASVQRGS